MLKKSICYLLISLAGVISVNANGAEDMKNLSGYTNGAKVIEVEQTKGQIDVISGVIYSQVKSMRNIRSLKMTLLVPRTTDLKPAIIYFPGGGFTSADHEKFIEMRMALAEAGFVVAAAEYRVIPDKFPALVEDGKAAIRYLREHAKAYGIDPERIGVLGDSAGGYVVQMLGTTNDETQFDKGDYLTQSSKVQAVVTIYGISNLLNIGEGYSDVIQKVHQSPSVTEALLVHGPAFRESAGASITSDPKKALDASPMGHITKNTPPFLILHGSDDPLVSPIQSQQLYEALKAQGNATDYILVRGAGHGDRYWFQPIIIHTVVDWFKATLGEPIPSQSSHDNKNANL